VGLQARPACSPCGSKPISDKSQGALAENVPQDLRPGPVPENIKMNSSANIEMRCASESLAALRVKVPPRLNMNDNTKT